MAGQGETINPRVFGRYLSRNRDRVVDGHQLEQPDTWGNALRWRVTGVTGVNGVPTILRGNFRNAKNSIMGITDSTNSTNSTNVDTGSNGTNMVPAAPGTPLPVEITEASPAADVPPLPTTAEAHQRFVFILNTGRMVEHEFSEPITLPAATVAGRKLFGSAFVYAEARS